MDEPLDHHYLPVFYLSRWVGEDDGRICRFQRMPTGVVKAKRVVPKGTGYEPRLYETRGLPPDKAQTMEKDFMAKLDNLAAQALVLLEQGLPEQAWTSGPRSAWSRFILAQMLRAPEDIAQLKSSVSEDWGKAIPQLQTAYDAGRSADMPATIGDYLRQQVPGETDEFALSIARTLMNHPKVCGLINNMHWHVIEIPPLETPLATSDRPVWTTTTLTEPDAFISMPIGPRRLFIAAPQASTLLRLKARPPGALAADRNKLAIQHAVKYAYGVDDALLPLVQEHLGTRRHSSLLELMAATRDHKIVAADSPMASRPPPTTS
jgi:hypothetical protein